MATTDKKPSFGVALGTFIIVAAIIAYGLLGLGMDAHVPIAMAATAAALIGKFVVGVSWEDMEIAVFNAITSSLGALLILITIGMLVGAWVQAGVVPGLIYYGFNLLSPGIFLLASLLICSIIGIAIGASWGVGATVGGIVYIVLPWTFMMLIRMREHGAMFLLTLFFCTWCCDVAAYFTGSHFGRTPLCSQVSPHKTWEGFAGGAAASLMCGGLLALIFSFPPLPLLLLGLLCGVAGQLGDLGESVLKREAGVKDTGNIIPGHGGMLDRFDSILVNGTLAFVIFELVG